MVRVCLPTEDLALLGFVFFISEWFTSAGDWSLLVLDLSS